jgi:hypothetical protein
MTTTNTTPTGTEAGFDLDKLEAELKSILRNLDRDYIGSVRESVDEIGEMIYRARQAAPATTDSASGHETTLDDGSIFKLSGWAGGAAPGGAFSTVTCEHRKPDGTVEVIDYVRAAQPVQAGALPHAVADRVAAKEAARASGLCKAESASQLCIDCCNSNRGGCAYVQPVQAGEAVDERALFDAWMNEPCVPGSKVQRWAMERNGSARALIRKGWMARASLAPVSAQQGAAVDAKPYGWVQFIDGQQTQNFARDEAELENVKWVTGLSLKGEHAVEYVQVFDRPTAAAKAPAAQAQPSTRAVLRKLVDIGKDRALTAAEVEHFQRMIEGMEAGRGLNVSDAPAAQAVTAPAGVTLHAFKGADTKEWHVAIQHPFGTSWVRMSDPRDIKLAELIATSPASTPEQPLMKPEAWAHRTQFTWQEVQQVAREHAQQPAAPDNEDAPLYSTRQDAARYRWLRNPDPQPHRGLDVLDDDHNIIEGKALDAAIDAAMRATQQEGGNA